MIRKSVKRFSEKIIPKQAGGEPIGLRALCKRFEFHAAQELRAGRQTGLLPGRILSVS
jgi:hypothetical protein